jgi:hypothetical protein
MTGQAARRHAFLQNRGLVGRPPGRRVTGRGAGLRTCLTYRKTTLTLHDKQRAPMGIEWPTRDAHLLANHTDRSDT